MQAGSPVVRALRLLARVASMVGLTLIAVAAAVVCLICFPPQDVMRRAGVALARTALHDPALDLGQLRIEIGRHGVVALERLTAVRPPGYASPLLTVQRLALHYDVQRLLDGAVAAVELEVDRPVLRVEERAGKPNWQVFLEQFPPSPPKPEEPAGELPQVDVELDVAVRDLRIYVEQGMQRAALAHASLALEGRYQPAGGKARLTLQLDPPAGQRASFGLRIAQPAPIEALLNLGVKLVVDVDRMVPLKARTSLHIAAETERLQAPRAIPPTSLALLLRAAYDQANGQAQLQRLETTLNGAQLLALDATAEQLEGDPHVRVHVEHVALPLAALQPYLQLVEPSLRCKGTIAVRDLVATSALSRLVQRAPPIIAGRLTLTDVSLAVQPGPSSPAASAGPVALDRLRGTIHFASRIGKARVRPWAARSWLRKRRHPSAPNTIDDADAPPVAAEGSLRWDRLRAAGADVRSFALVFGVGAAVEGVTPSRFAAAVGLRIGALALALPQHATVRTPVELDAEARGDLVQRRAELERFELALGKIVALTARARVDAWGERALDTEVQLRPLALATLWSWLPATMRDQLPLRSPRGKVSLRFAARGRLPEAGTPPLRVPLNLDAALELHDVGFELGAMPDVSDHGAAAASTVAVVRGLGGAVRLQGPPSRLRLAAEMALAHAALPASGVTVSDVTVPLQVALDPRHIRAELSLTLSQLQQRHLDLQLRQRGIRWKTRTELDLPLEPVIAGKAVALGALRLESQLGIDSVRLQQPGVSASIKGVQLEASVTREAAPGALVHWALRSTLASVAERQQAVDVDALELKLGGRIGGIAWRLPFVPPPPTQLSAEVDGALAIGRVRHPALDRPLVGPTLALVAALRPRGPLVLKRLVLALPSLGAEAELGATLDTPFNLDPHQLPTLRASARLELKHPVARTFAGATELYRGLRSAGSASLRLSVARTDPSHVALRGRFGARDFSLWLVGAKRPLVGAKRPSWLRSSVQLMRLDADVPLAQQLEVQLDPLAIRLPPPARSIFDQGLAGPAYRTMRPFVARRASLTLDQLTLREDLLEAGADQRDRVVSSSSLDVGRTVLDVSIENNALQLSHLAMRLFGGDVVGDVLLQLTRLDPPDLRLGADMRLTNVDLARLDPEAQRSGKHSRVSALASLKYELASQAASGQILLTDLSLDTLDSLLAYLDPHKLDTSIQANRKLINAWYTRMTRPEVDRVSVWIDHSQLNLDIRLGALWPFGAVLRRVMHGLRIRRVSLRPFLPTVAAERSDTHKIDRGARQAAGWIAAPEGR